MSGGFTEIKSCVNVLEYYKINICTHLPGTGNRRKVPVMERLGPVPEV